MIYGKISELLWGYEQGITDINWEYETKGSGGRNGITTGLNREQ